MIVFLRKIRQSLLSEGKTVNYLKYAIGEIILVVIGILIALQINNWNEKAKERAFEREMLAQIRQNLGNDKAALQNISLVFTRAIASSEKILQPGGHPNSPDSLRYWLADIIQFERFQPILNSYETLKSAGLDKISDKHLRMLLGAYYDDEVNHVIKSVGDIEYSFNNLWLPVLREMIVDFKFRDYVIVQDPTVFDRPTVARNIIILNKDNYNGGLDRVNKAIGRIGELEVLLEKYTP